VYTPCSQHSLIHTCTHTFHPPTHTHTHTHTHTPTPTHHTHTHTHYTHHTHTHTHTTHHIHTHTHTHHTHHTHTHTHACTFIHLPSRVFHLRADNPQEAETWISALKHTQVSGIPLAEQQLTNGGIPILVHKCLQFIESYGLEIEGLYRLSGVKAKIRKLILAFNQGEWVDG